MFENSVNVLKVMLILMVDAKDVLLSVLHAQMAIFLIVHNAPMENLGSLIHQIVHV